MKRLPIIRHIRWMWHSYWCYRYAQEWQSAGIGIGGPNESDLKRLQDICDGKA